MNSGHVSSNMMVPAGIDPEAVTSAQRLDKVAGILAGAVLRLWVKHGGGRKK